MTNEQQNVFKTFNPDDLCDFLDSIIKLHVGIPAINKPSRVDLHELEMASTADTLIEFANKWSDKLKKIKGK